ncbi:MAG: tRNA (N(6)-L-threonylcarbamoyladenosine(37)-C(2))-methylthiotransferase MtaB [Bacteroidales bacterium]|jgi:threonylcarbamoyladenosine tRNA methylthiotransferase MtaB|nr:tRNA (N(6)-L-threonylcarbamoyladenosine(37)-C(2))-methylthiotransferase MtaB [Bacteroidales bacterium]
MKKVAFHTLGCKLNFSETSSISKTFLDNGYEIVPFKEFADVYVINTCSVTLVAEKKCRNAIHNCSKINPKATIAVIGCFAQIHAEEIKNIKGVNIVLGNTNKHLLLDFINKENDNKKGEKENNVIDKVEDISKEKRFVSSYSVNDRTRSFLKIQDGCDYFCSYCTIPFARGRSRSSTIEEAYNNALKLSENNVKEIVLTGVNIGDFGKGVNEDFFSLIKKLDTIEQIKRFRISSIEPNLLTEDIINFVKDSRSFMPHFHIPLQGGTDSLLRKMNRRYDRKLFENKINYIHKIMPYAFIAADVIVGFNGESEEEFLESINFISSLPLSFLHVFTFSERPNTLAIKMDGKVPINLRRERSHIMQEVSLKKKKDFYNRFIGTKREILWESDKKEGMFFGFTDNYIKVTDKYNPYYVNTIQNTLISRDNIVIEK